MNTIKLVADGIAAAEGAKIVMNTYFESVQRDPYNNDNYCRLVDWIRAARAFQQIVSNEKEKASE